MEDKIYPYCANLYDRKMLNCLERQSIVFLKEKLTQIDYLLYRAFIATDDVFKQLVLEKKAKYNFYSKIFDENTLNSFGIQSHEISSDCFAKVKLVVDEAIKERGFVSVSGSVFYFPHCPEYRKTHINHYVILKSVSDCGNFYEVVDDNSAGHLCKYIYSSEDVSRFYDNNGTRNIRYFALGNNVNDSFTDNIHRHLNSFFSKRKDDQVLLKSTIPFLISEFDTTDTKARILHDSYCLLSGSRNLFAHFLETGQFLHSAIPIARDLSKNYFLLKNMMIKFGITNELDYKAINILLNKAIEQECELFELVKYFVEIS